MQKKITKKQLPLFLCAVFVMALAVFTTACSSKSDTDSPAAEDVKISGNILGEGDTQFAFTVVDGEGNETEFEIHTNKETVGDALEELGVIAGDEDDYGLYVKTVNGITVDYDKDGKYWAFYVDGQYATEGVSSTAIEEGKTYSFKVE